VSTSCPSATSDTPLCGPWSAVGGPVDAGGGGGSGSSSSSGSGSSSGSSAGDAGCVAGQITTGWPQQGFDPGRSAASPSETTLSVATVSSLVPSWHNSTPSTINSGPVVANATVFYGDYVGNYYAANATTGALVWQKMLTYGGDGGSTGVTENGSAVACGMLYVTERCTETSCGTVFALDASTGTQLWAWSSSTDSPGDPVVSGNIIYLSLGSGTQALNAATGAAVWNVAVGGSPAVAGSFVYVTNGSSLFALNASNGNLAWTGSLPAGTPSRPTVASSYVYVTSSSGVLSTFAASGCGSSTCAALKSYPLLEPPGDAASFSVTPPAVADGMVFVGSGSTVSAYSATPCDAGACTAAWSTASGCPSVGMQPSVANGVVYLACGNNVLSAFSASSGELLWNYMFASEGYPLRSEPSIADGRLFIGDTFDFAMYSFALPGP
jgi:outer membrane protein assembly factor BamB